MQTDALRWFQQVADGITVTEVSELDRVTQSGVSRALARLEAEVGTPLLQRSGRTLRMTRAGAAFKRHVDAMMHQLDDGLAAVTEVIDPNTGTVAVACQASLASWLLPTLISGFRATHPEVRFALAPVREEHGPSGVEAGTVDLEISVLRERRPGLRWKAFLTQRLVLAVPWSHPLAGRPETALAAAAEETFVGLPVSRALRRQGDELCRAAGFEPTIGFECADLATVNGFVAAGLGVAVVPEPPSSEPQTTRATASAASSESTAARVSTATTAAPVAISAGDRSSLGSHPVARRSELALVSLTDPTARREIGVSWSAERRLLPAPELFRQHILQSAARGRLA